MVLKRELPDGAAIIKVHNVLDDRGNLAFMQGSDDIPFDIKRVFWIYNIPEGKTRGCHSHRTCDEIVIPISGSFIMELDNGKTKSRILMNRPDEGILVPAGMWCKLSDFTQGTICLCVASQEYLPEGYIHDYEEYKKEKGL